MKRHTQLSSESRDTEEPPSALGEYGVVPSAFEVREVFAVSVAERGLGGLRLKARAVEAPYVKDYDTYPANHPTDWAARFDVSRWGCLAAWLDGQRVGGAVIAWDTPGLGMLEDRSDLAVLWDIRVAPAVHRRRIGTALFRAAEEWAAVRGARQLKVETQNVNAAACRFYARQGCTLGAIRRFAYLALPDEVQLLWYKDLVPLGSASCMRGRRRGAERSIVQRIQRSPSRLNRRR